MLKMPVCVFLGAIVPIPGWLSDLAYDMGADGPLCPPTGGSSKKNFMTYKAFVRLIKNVLPDYNFRNDIALNAELFKALNDAVEKCLILIYSLRDPLSETLPLVVGHEVMITKNNYVSTNVIKAFFTNRNRQIINHDISLIQSSIDHYLEGVLLKADQMKKRYIRIQNAQNYVVPILDSKAKN